MRELDNLRCSYFSDYLHHNKERRTLWKNLFYIKSTATKSTASVYPLSSLSMKKCKEKKEKRKKER